MLFKHLNSNAFRKDRHHPSLLGFDWLLQAFRFVTLVAGSIWGHLEEDKAPEILAQPLAPE